MSIVPLKKVTCIALKKDKKDFLLALQSLGSVHLIDLKSRASKDKLSAADWASPRAVKTYKALKFLESVKYQRRQISRDPTFDVDAITKQALSIKESLREANDKREFLQQRIQDMEPWGDIEFPPKEDLKGYHFWFYMLPRRQVESLKTLTLPWQIVSQTPKYAYVIVIAKQEPEANVLPVPRVHLGALPMRELRYQLEQVVAEIEDLQAQRQSLTRFLFLLRLHLAEADNKAMLAFAAEQSIDAQHWIIVQAWLPVNALEDMSQLCRSFESAYVVQDPAPDEQPPTLLDQPEALDAGVDMALFYQTPDYRSWDPTKILLGSFCLFFAMILADAGYAVVLMLALLTVRKKLLNRPKGRAYFLLGSGLCLSTLLYGAMVGSYFGVTPAPDSVLAHIHILHLNDFDSMMRLSILIGAIHICLANAMQTYALRHTAQKWAPVGWILAVCSGVSWWQLGHIKWVEATSIGLVGLAALLIVIFSSVRPADTARQHLLRLLDGTVKLTGVMGAFGDVLSYMRLFALGLASASLAITFNQLAVDVYHSAPGIGLLGAILILILGHLLNILLSLISGVVHGLRLNFIEFYKWGLPTEGKPYQRFARKEINHE